MMMIEALEYVEEGFRVGGGELLMVVKYSDRSRNVGIDGKGSI